MEYTTEIISKMVGCGTLGYPLKKIINILDIDNAAQFAADFYNPASAIALAYQKGVDKADYAIDMKLFDLAKNGDLVAIKEYERRKQAAQKLAENEKHEWNFKQK